MIKKRIPWELIHSSLKDELNDDQKKEFASWIEDSRNKETYDDLSDVWGAVQSMSHTCTPDKEAGWKKMEERLGFSSSEDLDVTEKGNNTKRINWKIFSVAASLLLLISISTTAFLANKVYFSDLRYQSYSTINGKSKILLPDGTEVWMNKNTTLTYSDEFGEKERRVVLDGEAYFMVTHNRKSPFIVSTGDVNVQVYGTEFNVIGFEKDDFVTVSLEDGSVALTSKTNKDPLYMFPGETYCYQKSGKSFVKDEVNIDYLVSWAKEDLTFVRSSLYDISRILSNWYDVDIIISEELVNAGYAYTFKVEDESLKEILQMLSITNPIGYKFVSKDKVLIFPKQ